MDERISRALNIIDSFERLAIFEANIRRQNVMNAEVEAALEARGSLLAHKIITQRTGLQLSNLTPAEEDIVQAVAKYIGIMKRRGKDAGRTLQQLKNQGLIGSAEIAVAKSKPTQGFQVLKDEDLENLSYERIILSHPQEFTPRAIWYARRTLGEPTNSDRPPAKSSSPTQSRTEELIEWMLARTKSQSGGLGEFTNAEAAAAIGFADIHHYGRAFGNIFSRIDFACYRLGLPPLGLTAQAPFENAWGSGDRDWDFPVHSMQRAARTFKWTERDFARVLDETRAMPGSAHLLWIRELTDNSQDIRQWAGGLEDVAERRKQEPEDVGQLTQGNPDWTYEEHILGLDLYLRLRGSSYSDDAPEVMDLSAKLQRLAAIRGMKGGPTFRNPNGVSMKMMNFRRLDPLYTKEGRVGLASGSKLEERVWKEFADDSTKLSDAVEDIETFLASEEPEPTTQKSADSAYWVFVCNPAKWAIDRFFESGVTEDSWGVRPSDKDKFAPGQLGVVRVGVDRRSAEARGGRPPLEAGIYALCEVQSETFPGAGANGEYWAEDSGREPGWPTVRLRYLRVYRDRPLTIEHLRTEKPDISPLLLNGHQAASFPISGEDFRAVVDLLGEDTEELPVAVEPANSMARLAELEERYLKASVEVKIRVGKCIERGPIGNEVKKANGHKCQLCEALGNDPIVFRKPSGEPYVEAHHVMPVSSRQIGTLSAANIMTLCPNHHRQMHYGNVSVTVVEDAFEVTIDGTALRVEKTILQTKAV